VLSYREASRDKDAAIILQRLDEGAVVALISDAGTPAISDPGWHVVDLARQAGHPVWAIPGPCAAIQALALAGFPCRRFVFEGFLPASGRQRREALKRLNLEQAPVILYESPHSLLDTLNDLAQHLEPRPLYIGRELTKKFEESWRGSTADAGPAWKDKRVQGEFTLVLGAKARQQEAPAELPVESVGFLRSLDLPTKTATAILKHFYPTVSKKELYASLAEKPGSGK
jgi:16S rRNA (cytidine1402-2'-O)-methyltransferase